MKDKDGNYRPTFVVLEDLNTGFKRSRQKFEQQVYQKFELALAKKLNYLVDKSVKDINQIGSVANALQLTLPVANYQDIENRKQVGIMLYTRANYTSVTDPATGWRKTIYLKGGSEAEIKKQIVGTKENQFKDGAFSEIGFEGNDYFFTYTDKNSAKEWMLWSGKNGESLVRYRFKRGNSKNESIIESIDVKPLLDKLFEKFDKSTSLKTQLENGKELQKVNGHTVWETLRFVIDIIQQIRNSGDVTKKQDDNFLLSPVRNGQGEHFDSRKGLTMLPKDADANGAYNIARKGIIMYEHIKHLGDEWNRKVKIDGNDTIDLDLFISDKEWDLWLTNREKWKSSLNYFASKEIKDEKNK
jgi:CRISPR-associated protein Cpf1